MERESSVIIDKNKSLDHIDEAMNMLNSEKTSHI